MKLGKTERFELRLDRETLERVDSWRQEQLDRPSRAEAMRRLVNAGLTVVGKGGFQVSHGEMLTLSMLCDVHKHLGIKNGIEPDFVERVIDSGHWWALQWRYPGVFHGDVDTPSPVFEVVNILEMWFFLETGFAKLSKEEQAEVESEVSLPGTFPGFDGNNESEYLSIAYTLVKDLDRFTMFKNRDLNSHWPLLEEYRRMFREFEPIRPTLVGRELSCSEIIALSKAQGGSARQR